MILRSCRRCGCAEQNCHGCVERTGAPCSWIGEDLCSACVDLALPREMTPAIAEVLGLPNFRTSPIAHLFRAGGAEIKPKCEVEQAFVLWRFLHLAILHADNWAAFADADIQATLARVKAARPVSRLVDQAGHEAFSTKADES